jgi:hypothetical protein
MNILSISKKDKEAVVRLSSDELVKLSNVLYNAPDEDRNDIYYKLYGDIMLARDLSQYGHIDAFCFERISKCREKLNK